MLAQTGNKIVAASLDWKPSVAEQVVALGKKHHGHYHILPVSGVIDKPVVLDIPGKYHGWTAIPREMDNSFVPGEADRQARIVKQYTTVLQEIILHEPQPETEAKPQRDYTKLKEAGTTLGKVAVAGLTIAVTAAGFLLYALAMGVMTDPALVVILEDGTWVSVCEWEV